MSPKNASQRHLQMKSLFFFINVSFLIDIQLCPIRLEKKNGKNIFLRNNMTGIYRKPIKRIYLIEFS